MATYVVTGGAGFIGSNLVEELLKRGATARVVDDFSTGSRESLAEAPAWAASGGGRFELLPGDIRDATFCTLALDGADYVLHHAAIPSVPWSVRDPQGTNAVNVTGTLNLLCAARDARVRRFVYASSSAVYGDDLTLPKVETMAPAPVSPYALQKLAGEVYCRLFHRLYQLPTVALRYFNVFGERQDPKSEYAAVVASFVEAFRSRRAPTIHGDGEQTRDFVHVSNAVRANLLACQAGPDALGETFNIACGERISLNRLVAVLAGISGSAAGAEHGPPRPGDVRHSVAALDRAARGLGYRPEVLLEEGLRRLWAHAS